MKLSYPEMVQMLMRVGNVVPFRPKNEISVPLPEPNQGYIPTPGELDMLKRILPQVIPFPGKK